MSKNDENIGEKIDKQSAELLDEFRQHVQEVQREQPGMTDVGLIFEGWIVQKVAGLQCLAREIADRVAKIELKKQ
jgi:hypothetical protein